mgnify:CR=1 FL=1
MNILFACIEFKSYTGMPMYIYELSRRYVQLGHKVSIVALEVGDEITDRARANGVDVYSFKEMPQIKPDVLHLNEYEPSYLSVVAWPRVPAVATVHSQYPCEQPFNHPNIKRYICIRPEIIDKIKRGDGIPASKIRFIPNGIDFDRFNTLNTELKQPKKLVVFAGTIDPLRKKSIVHLVDKSINEDFNLLLIGKKHDTYLDHGLPSNVEWMDSVWDIESYIKQADETAGILLGRTTLESWRCGIPCWIYDVDLQGCIKSVKLHQPPKDIDKYNINNVADRILALYKEVLSV